MIFELFEVTASNAQMGLRDFHTFLIASKITTDLSEH
jgi:hypothetical protein